jgi:Holliday junction DNA helicase RuvA
MIATLRGRILGNTDQQLIVEVGGVGFAVTTVPGVRLGNEIGREIFLFTALIVREDAFTLFGYQTSTERDLFQLLQTVSGIGPKVSHAILSTLTVSEIVVAITAGDGRALEQVSGLGKKGAQRIILELKDRVAAYGSDVPEASSKATSTDLSLAQALAGLGFNSKEIDHALDIVKNSAAASIEEGLKIALAALHNGGPRV